jgi:hypothetical protein
MLSFGQPGIDQSRPTSIYLLTNIGGNAEARYRFRLIRFDSLAYADDRSLFIVRRIDRLQTHSQRSRDIPRSKFIQRRFLLPARRNQHDNRKDRMAQCRLGCCHPVTLDGVATFRLPSDHRCVPIYHPVLKLDVSCSLFRRPTSRAPSLPEIRRVDYGLAM